MGRIKMIEGITILSQEVIKEAPEWFMTIIATGLIVIVIGLILMFGGVLFDYFRIVGAGIIIIFVSAVVLLGTTFISMEIEKPTDRYEYKVIVDDSAALQKMYDKYEIVDVEGMIYTIRDKEYE